MPQGIIRISLEVLAHALLLPEDCRPVGCYYDEFRKTLQLVVESPAIPATVEGEQLPTVLPCYERLYEQQGDLVRLVELKVSSLGSCLTSADIHLMPSDLRSHVNISPLVKGETS